MGTGRKRFGSSKRKIKEKMRKVTESRMKRAKQSTPVPQPAAESETLETDVAEGIDVDQQGSTEFGHESPSAEGDQEVRSVQQEVTLLETESALSNLVHVRVPGDGNCLFSSLAYFVFGNENHHWVARKAIAKLLQTENEDEVQILANYLGVPPLRYLQTEKMDQPNVWGTEKEIQAAATLIQAPIVVFRPHNVTRKLERLVLPPLFQMEAQWRILDAPKTGDQITLVCSGPRGDHYDPLIPADIVASASRPAVKRQLFASSAEPQLASEISPPPLLRTASDLITPEKKKGTPLRKRQLSVTPRTYVAIRGQAAKLKLDNNSLKQQLSAHRILIRTLERRLAEAEAISASKQPSVAFQKQQSRTAAARKTSAMKQRLAQLSDELQKLKRQQGKIRGLRITWADNPIDPMKVRIRNSLTKSKLKGNLFHLIHAAKVAIAYVRRDIVKHRIQTLRSVIGTLAGPNPTAFMKATLISEYLKTDPGTLAILKNDKAITQNLAKLTPEDTARLIHRANLTGAQAAKIRSLLHKVGMQVMASDHQVRRLVMDRQLKCDMKTEKIALVRNKKIQREDGRTRIEKEEVEKDVHRAASLVSFIQETWEKTRNANELVNSPDFGNKIWVAIGGDKGGGTTKIVVSYLNVASPASIANLHVLAIYDGGDSAENLRRVLQPYVDEWAQLNQLQLPYQLQEDGTYDSRPLLPFLYGDIMFQTAFWGLRGPASKYPCFLCLIPQKQLKHPGKNAFEVTYQNRSLSQYSEAVEKGKFTDGVAALPIFPIPVEQHVPPVLHLFLGIGTMLLDCVEASAKKIDLKKHGPAVEEYIQKFTDLSRKVEQLHRDHLESIQVADGQSRLLGIIHAAAGKQKDPTNECTAPLCFTHDTNFFGDEHNWVCCDTCQQWFHTECCMVFEQSEKDTLRLPEVTFTCPKCQGLSMEPAAVLEAAQDGVTAAVEAQQALKEEYENTAAEKDAMEAQELDQMPEATMHFEKALQKLGIDRQAFHGGVFIGNHIKKAVDGQGPAVITECLSDDKHQQQKYFDLLTQLNKIRQLMSVARFLTDSEINDLKEACKKIGEFSDTYRGDDETVIPKMHILVMHVPQFAQRWRTVGLISEHGIEPLNGSMNKLFMRYACIRGLARKLAMVTKEHERRQEGARGK